MEFLNKNYKIKKGFKGILILLLLLAFIPFLINGIMILVLLGITIWFGIKGIKFIKEKVSKFNNTNIKKRYKDFKICHKNSNYKNTSHVPIIDVEYEEVHK